MTSTVTRKSLDELGLVLPFSVWLSLFVMYVGSAAVLFFVKDSDAPMLRMIALAISMFIMGVFFAFKMPLWVPRQS